MLNRVGSDRHARRSARRRCAEVGMPVLGVVAAPTRSWPRPSRHLGLVPAAERGAEARRRSAALAALVAAAASTSTPSRPSPARAPRDPDADAVGPGRRGRRRRDRRARPRCRRGRRSGVHLRLRRERRAAGAPPGCEVVVVDPLRDEALPAGHGRARPAAAASPRCTLADLAANAPLRAAVRRFAARRRTGRRGVRRAALPGPLARRRRRCAGCSTRTPRWVRA